MEEKFYEEYAQIEATHWWFEGRRAIFDGILRSLDLPKDSLLVDLGCGTGANLNFLTGYGKAIGLDWGAAAARYARQRTSVPVFRGDVTALPFRSGSVDLITAFDLVEHIDDDSACVRELARVCRPGGHVLVTVPAAPWMWGRQDTINHHKRRYSGPDLADLFREQGLEIRRFTHLNTLLYPVVAAVRLFRRVVPEKNGELVSDFSMNKPGPMNTILGRLFSMEAHLIKHWDLPVGVSLLCLARKPLAA
ncbi:MAG TPA: methyltransferase domain-containing protein [Candidatus Acidoferrales bacterium]|nr:methyltransferase domain-containing protein [Candidatus Acidoferrales bacterium]